MKSPCFACENRFKQEELTSVIVNKTGQKLFVCEQCVKEHEELLRKTYTAEQHTVVHCYYCGDMLQLQEENPSVTEQSPGVFYYTCEACQVLADKSGCIPFDRNFTVEKKESHS